MPIEKLGIRWSNKQKRSRREYNEIESLKDDIANLEAEVRRLNKIIQQFAYSGDRTDLYEGKRWK